MKRQDYSYRRVYRARSKAGVWDRLYLIFLGFGSGLFLGLSIAMTFGGAWE